VVALFVKGADCGGCGTNRPVENTTPVTSWRWHKKILLEQQRNTLKRLQFITDQRADIKRLTHLTNNLRWHVRWSCVSLRRFCVVCYPTPTGQCHTVFSEDVFSHFNYVILVGKSSPASSFTPLVSVVVRRWLGNRDCTAQYNHHVPVTTDCRRFCPLCLIMYGAPAMSLT